MHRQYIPMANLVQRPNRIGNHKHDYSSITPFLQGVGTLIISLGFIQPSVSSEIFGKVVIQAIS